MVLKLDKTSYHQLIRVAVKNVGDVMKIVTNKDGQITVSGAEGLLLNTVFKALGYRYEFVVPADGEWGDLKNGNWTGMMGEMENNRADLAWSWIVPIEERHRIADFSNIYHSEAVTFGVAKPYPIRTAFAIIYPFDLSTWIGVFAIIFLMPLFFLVISKRYSYLDLFLQIFGSILKQPLSINISSKTVLLLLVFWLVFTQLISCFYCSVLLSFLTEPMTPKIPRNFQELSAAVSKGNLKCYTPQKKDSLGLFNSKEEYLVNLAKYIEINYLFTNKFLKTPLKMTENFAVIHFQLFFEIKNTIPDSRPFIVSDDNLYSGHCVVAMRKDFCCKEKLNVMLARAIEAGLYSYYLKVFGMKNLHPTRIERKEAKPLSLEDSSGAFIILISGILLSISLFILEILFSKCSLQIQSPGAYPVKT